LDPDPSSKTQDVQTTFLGSRAQILDPDPSSKIFKKRVLDPGQKALDPNGIAGSKIFQEKFFIVFYQVNRQWGEILS